MPDALVPHYAAAGNSERLGPAGQPGLGDKAWPGASAAHSVLSTRLPFTHGALAGGC